MRLTKHHGLGNDFLVLIDLDGLYTVDERVATTVCDRHRGVGADGLIRVTRGAEAPFRMELRNADGSRAEMSGNGISCLAQAVLLAGLADRFVAVETDAGPRTVTVVDRPEHAVHRLRVAMGTPVVGSECPEWESDAILRAVLVDVGNPHLVCHVPDPDDGPDVVALGEAVNEATPGGANVELMSIGPRDGELTMTVYERGVGPTLACGTGAVAVAAAARYLELAPQTVTVHQPGGPAVVEVGAPSHLTVPVHAVAEVRWPWR